VFRYSSIFSCFTVPKSRCQSLHEYEGQILKLTIELADDLVERIRAITQRQGPASTAAFVRQALENELECAERAGGAQSGHSDLPALTRQIQILEEGQRAIIALVDSSATGFAALLQDRRPRR
jgi:DNA-binding ferritin-like protein